MRDKRGFRETVAKVGNLERKMLGKMNRSGGNGEEKVDVHGRNLEKVYIYIYEEVEEVRRGFGETKGA